MELSDRVAGQKIVVALWGVHVSEVTCLEGGLIRDQAGSQMQLKHTIVE